VAPTGLARPAQSGYAPSAYSGSGFLGTIREPFTGAWQMNKECTAQTALAFSGVYSCVMTIADDVSKVPIMAREIDTNGIAAWRPDHWASRLFKRPNPFQTRLQFVQQYTIVKLLAGNVYVVFLRDLSNRPVSMFILDPRTVAPFVTWEGEVYYQVNSAGANSNALAQLDPDLPLLAATDVLHDRMATVFHPLIGVSPLFAAGASASAGFSIIQNSKSFFQNMSRASGVLTAPGKISKETAERMAEKWKANFTSGNIGQVAVLGDGLKWEALTMTAADAQLIDILRWTIEDVARVFRVPLFMLGDLSKVSYKNSEQLARTYYQSTLQWHYESIEIAFDKFFDFGPSMYMEFDLDTLFRTEIDTRFQAYQVAINAGINSVNEIRAKENYPPVKGGDEPRVQMQYVPLSQALEPPAPPAPIVPPPNADAPSAAGGEPSDSQAGGGTQDPAKEPTA
jgi:HK97 family phage portal protein